MRLSDLKKLSIKQQYRIHFRLSNGMECIVSEQGIAKVPALQGIPDFNLETELSSAAEFLLEPALPPTGKDSPRPRTIGRDELTAMTTTGPGGGGAGHDEHDDE
jgi:hypothetical protein